MLGSKSANDNCVERAAVGPIARFMSQRSGRAARSRCAAGLVARGFRARYKSVGPVGEMKSKTFVLSQKS